MIGESTKKKISNILNVINDAVLKYKGITPNDYWNELYMLEQELVNEFNEGVHMFGHNQNTRLVGVMGIRKLKDIALIRLLTY